MLSPREFWALLVLSYIGFAELTSIWMSQWPLCIVVSEYQAAEDSASNQTCATLFEAIVRLIRFIWESADHDNITAFGTVMIAMFTLTLWRSTSNLWVATNKAAAAARDAAEHIPRVERAYVFLWREVSHATRPNPLGGDIFEINFAFHNYGKTPAIVRRIEGDIPVVDNYPTSLRDVGALDIPPALIISGDETGQSYRQSQLIMPDQWPVIQRWERRLLFLGRVVYLDIFGQERETGFCLELMGNRMTISPNEQLNYYT
jgi:hypothetical protein